MAVRHFARRCLQAGCMGWQFLRHLNQRCDRADVGTVSVLRGAPTVTSSIAGIEPLFWSSHDLPRFREDRPPRPTVETSARSSYSQAPTFHSTFL